MSKVSGSKTTSVALDRAAIAGVDQYFASVGKLTIAGTDYTPATLKAVLEAEIDAEEALDRSRAAVSQQVAKARTVRKSARTMRSALRKYILGTYGADAVQMLKDFGMKVPAVPGQMPVVTKAEAVVKATATKKAREEALKNAVPSLPAKGQAAAQGTTSVKA